MNREEVRSNGWSTALARTVETLFPGYFALVIPVAYPDPAALQTRAALMADPSGAFMTGPGYGLADYTFGVMIANEMLGMLAVGAALYLVQRVLTGRRLADATPQAGTDGRG